MLSEKQYKDLAPHRQAIKLTVESRATVSTAPYYAMDAVWQQLGHPPTTGYCGACVLELYNNIWKEIIQYESKPTPERPQ